MKKLGLNNNNNSKMDNKKSNEKIYVMKPKKRKVYIFFPPKKYTKKFSLSRVSIFNKNTNSKKLTAKVKPKLVQNYVGKSKDSFNYSKAKMNFPLNFENDEELFDDKKNENKKLVNKVKLTDYELNGLEYREAVRLDKRNFFQIYFASLKREHIVFFTFCACNDYNLVYVKIPRFFIFLATDMAMNVFFFSDESMHKIFLSYGKFDIIQQVPQILYSTIISLVLETFLCYLSMTDKYIYHIKKSKLNKKQIIKIIKCINLKLVTFFFTTLLLFCIYWYIVSSFCAVYQNTQIIFIKDSLSSFLIGIIYPLFIYLIPSSFRLCSLKSKKMRYRWLYKLSDIIPCF
jgi:hypothetical protein